MLAPADALAIHLATVEGLDEVPIIVGRQQDLRVEIDTAVAKAKGAAILIALEDWDNLVPDGSECHLELQHSISIYTTPILRRNGIPESQLLGLLVAGMQRHQPDPNDCDSMWKTARGQYVFHKKHRIYEFPGICQITLPAVTILDP